MKLMGMKYVFYTHSAITTRMCLGVIERERLEEGQIVWLTARDEKVESAGAVHSMEDLKDDLPCKGVNFLSCRRAIKKWRLMFDRLVGGGGFQVYLPQTKQMVFQLITTHDRCAGYYLIEEGMVAYHEAADVLGLNDGGTSALRGIFKKVYHYVNYGRAYREDRSIQDCFDERYLGCYTWNEFGFPGYENRRALECPFRESCKYIEVEALIVLDAAVEAGLVESGKMSEALRLLFRHLQKLGVRELGVKLHPETQKLEGRVPYWWEKALRGLEGEFAVTWIPRDFVVEELAMRKGMLVFVNLSSVGLYATLMGRKVVSIASLIAEHSPLYAKYIDKMPKIWSDSVTELK